MPRVQPVRVYVATRMREDAAKAIEAVRADGHVVPFDWTLGPRLTPETGPGIAIVDIEAIRGADAILLVWWPGMTGAYTELGAALALGKSVVVVAPDMRDNAFLWHPLVKRAATLAEAIGMLRGPLPASPETHGGTNR